MIQKIRRRFILIALCVLSVAMITVTVIINAANFVNVRSELRETLNYLAENGSYAQGMKGGNGDMSGMKGGRARRMRNAVSESRYFTAMISSSGRITLDDTAHDAEQSDDALSQAASQAFLSDADTGFSGSYMYAVTRRNNGSRTAVFLNIETKISSVKTLGMISLAACLGGILLAWLLVSLFSRRAIRPLVKSAVQQKQFITDAGHELKTPLTVIGANMDVLELDLGKNEWVDGTRDQLAKMREMVSQMVYLSRMDEDDAKLVKSDFDVTAAVSDTARPFSAMAEFAGKSFKTDVAKGVRATGDEAAIRRLVTILCDNTVKYTPEGGSIVLRCRLAGKKLFIETENDVGEEMTDESLKHLFDRFYRADQSRSKQTVSGTGLGLAIARAITEKHAGCAFAQKTAQGKLLISCQIAV